MASAVTNDDIIAHLAADALAGALDRAGEQHEHALTFATVADDESEFDVRCCEAAATWAAEMREQLDPVRSRRRVYRYVAMRWRALPASPFRALCYYLERADSDLDNVFPERKTAAAALGLTIKGYERVVRWLSHHGWIRTHEFRREDGTQSSSGIQLGIPFPSGAWWAPAGFAKHKHVTRKHRKPSLAGGGTVGHKVEGR